ncbi:hypothetical protein LCGC14_0819780 [marine sediment metagenome]|uniref:Uncharacterized protein n=1 Tax=marine sediment metagenome TaxID=412755 RepID=A0A0F9PNU8_9ZZZZ
MDDRELIVDFFAGEYREPDYWIKKSPMTDHDHNRNERAAREVMGWHWALPYGKGKKLYAWRNSDRLLAFPIYEDFDPSHRWEHAGLLLEKMREMSQEVQCLFSLGLHDMWVGYSYGKPYLPYILWLTPAVITRAAVEACEKEKG